MSVSIIDGTVESAEFNRSAAGIRFYKKLVFRLPNGDTKTLVKPISHRDLGPYLEPGTSGRFYSFSAIDHRGVHGFRGANGVSIHAHPKNNERLGLGITIFGVVMLLFYFLLLERISIWPIIMLVLGPLLWIANRTVRFDGQRQFDGDDGYQPTDPGLAPGEARSTSTAEPAHGS